MPPLCLICKGPAHGSHFGVMSCRACAAFFRRALFAKRERNFCKHDDKCTDFSGTRFPACKTCRMRRCLKVGMNSKNVQVGPCQSLERFVGRPSPLLFAKSSSPRQRRLIDAHHIIVQAEEILKIGSPSPLSTNFTRLEKMAFANFKLPSKCKKTSFVGEKQASQILKFDFLTAAKWLTHFEEFTKLHVKLQMQLLQAVWHVLARIRRIMKTSELWVKHGRDLRTIHLWNDVYIEMENTDFDVSWISNYSFEQVLPFLDAIGNQEEAVHLMNTIFNLKLTDTELAFMSAQLCFQYAETRFAGTETSDICENFQSILASELHDYYMERCDKNYAGRLASMMKINKGIQANIRQIREKSVIARTFDILLVDYSPSDMFIDSGC